MRLLSLYLLSLLFTFGVAINLSFMKLSLRLYLAFISLFIVVTTNAQNYVWAKPASYNAGGVMDRVGNSYIGGRYGDSTNLGDTILYGYSPIFLAKYNSSGKCVKAIQNADASTNGEGRVLGVATDNSQSIYLMGEYYNHLMFDSTTVIGDTTLVHYFIAKFDTSLNFYWIKSLNNFSFYLDEITVHGMSCDKDGDVYITGWAYPGYVVDSLVLNDTLTGISGSSFLLKIDGGTGSAVWEREIQSNCAVWPKYLVCDSDKNVFIAGTYGYSTSFPVPGGYAVFGTTDSLITDSASSQNVFVAKYTSMGNFQWVRQVDSIYNNDVFGLSTDEHKNIYLSGCGFPHGYFTKYDGAGNVSWLNEINRPSPVSSLGFNLASNFAYCSFYDTLIYLGDTIISPGGNHMVMKMDTVTGSILWHTPPSATIHLPLYFASLKGNLLCGDYIEAGNLVGNSMFINQSGVVAVISDTGFVSVNNNVISGNIFGDGDNNCLNVGEPGLSGFSVVAFPGPFYTLSDANGNYSLHVDTGTYTIQQIIPYTHTFLDSIFCPVSYSLPLYTSNTINTGFDFPNKFTECHLLKLAIDYSSTNIPGNFPYTNRVTSFTMKNYGSDTAHNVEIAIHYPNTTIAGTPNFIITPVRSNIPWTTYSSSDSVMTFVIGDLAPDSSVFIEVTDTVEITMAVPAFPDLAALHKYKVMVTPLNLCYPADSVYNVDSFFSHVYWPMGITNVYPAADQIQVYPNPSNGIVTISGLSGDGEIILENIVGSKVFNKTFSNMSKIYIDISNLPEGMYVMSALERGRRVNKKIVKL